MSAASRQRVRMVVSRLIATLYLIGAVITNVHAHPGGHGPSASDPAASRTWTLETEGAHLHGTFVSVNNGVVKILRDDGGLATFPIERLTASDRAWIADRQAETMQLNTRRTVRLVAQSNPQPQSSVPVGGHVGNPTAVYSHFKPFEGSIKLRWDSDYFFVESNGIPDHRMMVGITAWQQQVPLPQPYAGANAWRIPLHPTPARNPMSAKSNFFRGAIALAVNGVPIFNPIKNDGRTDTLLAGELDEFGGHCGRADDYHYHIAPVHLEKIVGKGKPIAYALDGYPIFGYQEPGATDFAPLDWLNGHKDAAGNYHYHASKTYPYLNGGFFGEVVERDGQVNPQPRAEGVRPALPPLRGAKITAYTQTEPNTYKLTYEIQGRSGTVTYTVAKNGSAKFMFQDPHGRTTAENYTPRLRGPREAEGARGRPRDDAERGVDQRGEGKGRRPPRPDDNPSQSNDRPGRGRPSGNAPPPPRNDRRPPPRNGDRPQLNDTVRNATYENGTRGSQAEIGARARGTTSNPTSTTNLIVRSSSIDSRGFLLKDCTCDGGGQSPAVEWTSLASAEYYAISLWHTAPDQEKSYWLVYNIPRDVTGIAQNGKVSGIIGLNDKRRNAYDPMCSKGPGVKEYHLTVFALAEALELDPKHATRQNVLAAIKNKTLATGTLNYKYERAEKQ